jgi:hypothetical protein
MEEENLEEEGNGSSDYDDDSDGGDDYRDVDDYGGGDGATATISDWGKNQQRFFSTRYEAQFGIIGSCRKVTMRGIKGGPLNRKNKRVSPAEFLKRADLGKYECHDCDRTGKRVAKMTNTTKRNKAEEPKKGGRNRSVSNKNWDEDVEVVRKKLHNEDRDWE